MKVSFNNKRVLVTGAGQGIGRDLVKELVKCGADVVALSRTASHLDTLKEELPQITTIACDVADSKKVRELVAAHGPYHCLANNAGIMEAQPFLDVDEESFDRLFNVNVKAVMVVSQVVAQMMVDNQIEGSIVNVSSRASKTGVRNLTVYCATKGALDSMSRVMALELGNLGIRVNCVNPTVVMTNMGKAFWSDPEKRKVLLNRIPLGKLPETEDVVNAVVFLLSDLSKIINGVTLPIDGGVLAT